MNTQKKSSSSLDSFSIKLTQTNIPSITVIKPSQDHISLTYTVSLENITHQQHSFNHLNQSNPFQDNQNDISIVARQQTEYSLQDYTPKQSILKQTQNQMQDILEKDVFKKKSVLKISNIDFSQFIEHLKQNSRQSTPQKSILNKKFGGNLNNRINNCSFGLKSKNFHQHTHPSNLQNSSHFNQIMIQSRQFSKSKDQIFNPNQLNADKTSQSFAQCLLLRTKRFNSIKQDKVVEAVRKNSTLIRKGDKQTQATTCSSRNKRNSISTQRKSLNPISNRNPKFPIIGQKGLSYASHPVNFTSTIMRKKAFTSYQNAQTHDKNFGSMTQKVLLGKSCKINEDDNKAKKYLKKIIQNRNSIIHFIE